MTSKTLTSVKRLHEYQLASVEDRETRKTPTAALILDPYLIKINGVIPSINASTPPRKDAH